MVHISRNQRWSKDWFWILILLNLICKTMIVPALEFQEVKFANQDLIGLKLTRQKMQQGRVQLVEMPLLLKMPLQLLVIKREWNISISWKMTLTTRWSSATRIYNRKILYRVRVITWYSLTTTLPITLQTWATLKTPAKARIECTTLSLEDRLVRVPMPLLESPLPGKMERSMQLRFMIRQSFQILIGSGLSAEK